MLASAPAFTKPRKPSWPRVTAYTRAAKRSRETASVRMRRSAERRAASRSEEHTSELQSLAYLVCRLLLEKKKTYISKSSVYGLISANDAKVLHDTIAYAPPRKAESACSTLCLLQYRVVVRIGIGRRRNVR